MFAFIYTKLSLDNVKENIIKVAPYTFVTVRTLMMQALVVCALSRKNVGFSVRFYDVSIARNSKVNSGFSRVSSVNFFVYSFAAFEIQMLPLICAFLKKIVISVKPSERPHIFPPNKMLFQVIFTR